MELDKDNSRASYELDNVQQDKLKKLIKISKYINSNIELEKLLNIIIKTSLTLVDSEESSLMLLDKNNDRLIFYSVSGSNETVLNQFSFPAEQGIAGEVIKKGEPIIIDDVQNDPRHFNKIDKELNFITKNIIAVPMKVGDKLVGIIEVLNAKHREKFSNTDLELLQYLADQSALAIINRELFQNVREKVDELSALYELSLASAFANTVDELLNKAVKILNQIFKVESCVIINRGKTDEGNKLYKSKKYDLNINPAEIFTENPSNTVELRPDKNVDLKNICTITIPLVAQSEVIGVLSIGDLSKASQFGELELRLLSTIANQISDACENIRLRVEEEEKKRIEKEVDIMRDLQQGIIPKDFPDFKSMKIIGYNLPAMEVGGDFYDVFKLSENEVGFVIADVSGKGASAGLFMALSRSILKVFAYNINSPSRVLYQSNNVIIEDSQNGMFVTMFYATMDTKNKKLKFSNGGHNPQIFYSKKKDKCEFLFLKGRPLGVIENSEYFEEEMDIEEGDILFLFTDGINESVNEAFEEFGDEKLLDIIKSNADMNVNTIKDCILDELKNFVGDAKQFDDITMLVVKYTGLEEESSFPKKKEIITNTETKSVGYIVDEVEKFLKRNNFREEIIEEIIIVIDEAVTNVIMYSYENKDNKKNKIICDLFLDEESITIEIHDYGENSPNLKDVMKPEFDINSEKVGGYGIFIMNNFMDELKFKRNEQKPENILVMKKYL